MHRILELLNLVYGADQAARTYSALQSLAHDYQGRLPTRQPRDGEGYVDERDAVLITYGDMVQAAGQTPLQSLSDFLDARAHGYVNTVHLLPFYPYSSDDGFSVIDYRQVDPALGSWEDVSAMGRNFQLMFDAVINHVSALSDWFQGFQRGEPKYADYFIRVDPAEDLSQVFRPRALPLLTAVETAAGTQHVWTTFSSDQIDLNYANPDVLLEVMDILLGYVARGACFIRLDAIGFMWKELGTSSIHLPQAHALIQLMRAVLDEVAPWVALITETNVPHADNISYFGDGTNEAQMVYNFSLPPLTLHAFHTGNAEILSDWAARLTLPSDQVTFFNFLASHDGIGVTPARGLLADDAVEAMAQKVQALGGHVSYKNNPDGSQTAYELNINYLDALGPAPPQAGSTGIHLQARRFLAAQAIMLALRGVPGIYFHSLFGSRSWPEGVAQTGRARSINRQKLQRDDLERELADASTLRAHVFGGYRALLGQRTNHPAFHPYGDQTIISCHPSIFALWRFTSRMGGGRRPVLALHNVSAHTHDFVVDLKSGPASDARSLTDLLSGRVIPARNGRLDLSLPPYEVLWLATGQV